MLENIGKKVHAKHQPRSQGLCSLPTMEAEKKDPGNEVGKASAKRKEKSKGSKSSKAVVDCTDSWCICGGPEWGDMIACERKDCLIE